MKWASLNAGATLISKLLRGAVIPKILDPASYGLFTSISLFTRYLQFADLGTLSYFIKQLPNYHFNKSAHEKQSLINATFTLILLSFCFTILYLSTASFSYIGAFPDFYKTALLVLIPVAIVSKLRDFFSCYLLGIQDYKQSALSSMISNYASLACVVAGVFYWGALGGVFGMLLAECSVFLYLLRIARPSMRVNFRLEIFQNWRQGLSQFMVSISELIVSTIDQIYILKVFDAVSLGIYALGSTFAWIFESISEILNTTSYPKLMAIANRNRTAATTLIQETMQCYFLFAGAIFPLTIYLVELIVTYYFGKYIDGLAIYSILLFGGIVRGGVALVRRGYIALNMEKQYIFMTICSICVYTSILSFAWLVSLPFKIIVFLIVALNLVIFVLLYLGLIKENGSILPRNILLIISSFMFVVIYQYFVRSNIFDCSHLDFGLLFLILQLLIFGGVAYRNRTMLYRYTH